MTDPAARLAHTVLGQNLKVRKGESVLIESWTHALPYAQAFVAEARRLGAHPTVLYEDERAWWNAVDGKKYTSVGTMSEAEKAALKAADVYVYFWGPEDRPRLAKLPDTVQEKITDYNEGWYKMARAAGVRGVRMTVGQATDPQAKTFGFDGADWRQRLIEAGEVDAGKMLKSGRRVVDRLRNGSKLRIRHDNGTDLTIGLRGVKTRVDVGLLDEAAMKRPYGMMSSNPSGQVFVAVDHAAAEGMFVSNRAVYYGPDAYDGYRWKFENGRLAEHSEGNGAKVFQEAYAKAPKGKDVLGYLSIGLNPKGRGVAPCEDTEEGAVLIGIGNNGIAGGKSKIPFQAFTMIGEATVDVDGKPLARGGRIVG
ncbi:MAG TPA: hypothetical protein VFF67_08850 [Thermoplasmata archaeon]|nr:hypothetical protein [Thermoplasmata archaeon]